MTLCTNDFQTTGFSCYIIQLDIGTTTCHIRSNSNHSGFTCMCNNFGFFLMIFCI